MTIGSSVFGNALRTIIWGGLGLVLLFGGIYFITTENAPECGGQSMQRGDECVGTRSGVRDFDEMKHADRTMGYVLAGFGSVLTLITGAGLLEDFRRRNLITVSDASLLSADEMAAITAMVGTVTTTSASVLYNDAKHLDQPQWVSAYAHGQTEAYQRDGFAGVRSRTISGESDGPTRRAMTLAIIGFDAEEKAEAVFTDLGCVWREADGQSLAVDLAGRRTRWTFGPLAGDADTLLIERTQQDGEGWRCWHAVTRVSNVLVEVLGNGYWEDHRAVADLLDAAVAAIGDGGPRPATRTLAPPASGPRSAAELDAVLPSPQRVAEIIGTPGLTRTATRTALYDDSATVGADGCVGAFALAQKRVFDGTGWMAARNHTLQNESEDAPRVYLDQAVVLMPSAEAAAAVLAGQKQQWSRLPGKMISWTNSSDVLVRNTYGPLVYTGALLAISRFEEGGDGWATQRAMTVSGRVVIDVQLSGRFAPATQAVDLATAIAASTPGSAPSAPGLPAPTPQPTPVTVAAAEALLLSPQRVAEIVGAQRLEPETTAAALYDDTSLLPEGEQLSPFALAQTGVYRGTGWLAVRPQKLTGQTSPESACTVFQAVLVFLSEEAATAALNAQRADWQRAVGRVITTDIDNVSAVWEYSALFEAPGSDGGGALSINRTQRDTGGWAVQRAIRQAGNVLIEVHASGRWSSPNGAGDLAATIAVAVPGEATAIPRVPLFEHGPLAFDTTGLVREPDSWVDPGTGDDFRIGEFTGEATGAPLDQLPELRRWATTGIGREGCIVSGEVTEVDGLPALVQLLKAPNPGKPRGVVYMASVVVPRAGRWVQLNAIFPEGSDSGVRDVIIGTRVGPDAMYPPHPYAPDFTSALPYSVADDARFDAEFPDHPVSRARRWIAAVVPTIRIDPAFAALPPR